MPHSRCLLPLLLLLAATPGCTHLVRESDVFLNRKMIPVSDSLMRRNVEVALDDETVLRGWRFTPPEPRFSMVYFYGQGMHLARDAHKLMWLADKLGIDILSVDYPGYGFSDGEPSVDALRRASLAVFDEMAALLTDNRQPIVVYGHSMGTAFATWVGVNRPRAAVILEAPFTSVEDVFNSAMERHAPWYIRWFVSIELEESLVKTKQPVELVAELDNPLLIVHGNKDEVVPIEMGKRMYQAARSRDKHWCEMEGADHFPVYPRRDGKDKLGCILAFLRIYLIPPPR